MKEISKKCPECQVYMKIVADTFTSETWHCDKCKNYWIKNAGDPIMRKNYEISREYFKGLK